MEAVPTFAGTVFLATAAAAVQNKIAGDDIAKCAKGGFAAGVATVVGSTVFHYAGIQLL